MRVKWLWICAIAVGVIAAPAALYALPVGTAFTYQGQLKQAGQPFDGFADFEFTLWDAEVGGTQVAGPVVLSNEPVSDGLFTVPLDFGEDVFTGEARWLEIVVDGTTLSPRQELTPAPYGLYSDSTRGIHVDDQGNVGIGTASPGHRLEVNHDVDTESVIYGKHVASAANTPAILGEATGPSGVGVQGVGGGAGVWGHVSPVGSFPYTGVYGEVLRAGGDGTSVGVRGYTIGNGRNYAIYGEADGDGTNYAVYGLASGAGTNYGVYGETFGGATDWAGYFEGRGYFSGNVGIGTATPAETLHVAGTMRVDSDPNDFPFQAYGYVDHEVALVWNTKDSMWASGLVGTTHDGGAIWTPSGVAGATGDGVGVSGRADSGYGVVGSSETGHGVWGMTDSASGYGVYGVNVAGGYGVYAMGDLGATGFKSFQIDHPLDPANAYLKHYCAEGPQPLNVYSGSVVLDEHGEARVGLPDYFESINRDFRYQLTPIGAAMPNLHVAEEIEDNHFLIAGGRPEMKVSWEVKGVRDDPYVRAYGAPVEPLKSPDHRGKYIHPELYGQPKELSVHYEPVQPVKLEITPRQAIQGGAR